MPDEFRAFVGDEVSRWKQVITAADVKIEQRRQGNRGRLSVNQLPCPA